MRTARTLAIGFLAAAECDPCSLDELAEAAGIGVQDGALFAIRGNTITLPAGAHSREAILAAALGSIVYSWAGDNPDTTPAKIAAALVELVAIRASRAPSRLRLRAISASGA